MSQILEKRKKVAEENYQIVKRNLSYIPMTCLLKRKLVSGNLKHKNSVEFLPVSTNRAIQHYLAENSNYKIAILNFANSHYPGGGYLSGASAQEEELCRTSPFLFASLNDAYRMGFYNEWKDDWSSQILYTPDVLFIRNDGSSSKNNYNFLQLDRQYYVSVITAAAPNLHKIKDLNNIPYPTEYENIIRQIYFSPIMVKQNKNICFSKTKSYEKFPEIDILILGAWGCGAFAPPFYIKYNKYVAERFVSALANADRQYIKISFAIPKNGLDNNYDIFLETFLENKNKFGSVIEIVDLFI